MTSGDMARIVILGAGMMGSALAVPLVDAGHEVRLTGTHLDGDTIASLKASHVHPKLGLELAPSIEPYAVGEIERAMRGVELVALGVSSAGVRWAGKAISPYVREDVPIVMITKGLEWNGRNLAVMPDVLRACLPEGMCGLIAPVAVAGPCIAGEIARRVETCVVLTGRDQTVLDRVRAMFGTSYYHVWTSTDVVGVEACAALKNAYAMGVGLAAGIHERGGGEPGSVAMHNYEAAVFAQSILEIQRIATAMGGQPASVVGLPGVGDLDVTCSGGRTGRFGRWLGLGIGVEEAVRRMEGATLECLEILRVLRSAMPDLERRGVLALGELPLLEQLFRVALDDSPVKLPFDRFFAPEMPCRAS
jgi:glycerol-3-phosphate dehydrogenase (NAD(P)+)